jgi:hypothetical protein
MIQKLLWVDLLILFISTYLKGHGNLLKVFLPQLIPNRKQKHVGDDARLKNWNKSKQKLSDLP